MCGFVGIFNGENIDKDFLVKSSLYIKHRGPDDDGYYINKEDSIFFAHRRLSITDLSEKGSQPMKSKSGRYIIIFNGEIYNHLYIRKILNMKESNSSTDTETLLFSFDKIGIEKTIKLCEGMFSFACWDTQVKELTLVRDRFGEKPLYYGFINKSFFFTSDLITLKQFTNFNKILDRDAIFLFFNYSYIPSPKSIFRDIAKLETASILRLAKNSTDFTIEKYWSNDFKSKINKTENFKGSIDEASNHLENLLCNKIQDQLNSKVSSGTYLSGGIDSSLITALSNKLTNGNLKTFNIGFDEKNYDESIYAKKIAKHLGTDHYTENLAENNVKDIISNIHNFYSEPFADSSQIPSIFLNQIAKKEITVALSGDGGDEIFGGYNRYFYTKKYYPLVNKIPYNLRALLSKIFYSVKAENYNIFFKNISYILPGLSKFNNYGDKIHKISKIIKYKNINDLYNLLISNSFSTLKNSIVLNSSEKYLMHDLNMYQDNIELLIERMMLLDTDTYLTDDILCKVDRASMANSIESRAPFLNHKIYEFSKSLPLNYKIDNNYSKIILRKILYKYFPKELIDRPKMGFGLPLGMMLRTTLKDWVYDTINIKEIEKEGYLDANLIKNFLKIHMSGKINLSQTLWPILIFQSWYKNL